MNKYKNSLKILRTLADDKLIGALLGYAADGTTECFNDLCYEIYAAGAQDGLLSAVQSLVLRNENAFSLTCAKGEKVSAFVRDAFLSDLKIIDDCVKSLNGCKGFSVGDPLPLFKHASENDVIDNLARFYAENGCGKFIDGKAYEYCGGEFVPLSHTSDITLDRLKNYAAEKKVIENNILDFINNLPFSHMLLYGDRGTGKSSTVHAMLNAYADYGLRLIEVDGNDISGIKAIRQKVAFLPLKFIIFIDDVTLNEQDDRNGALKAAIEGSVGGGKNVMIITTSNRRHIVKESFSERQNSVHPSDSMEEQLSLSDRFGITVMFSSTDKDNYLSIVRQLAADYKLATPTDDLLALAERYAIENGGRSPRRAKQFTDFIYACEKSGRKPQF